MSKKASKISYSCQNCGATYAKWQGQCYACKEWNTIEEEVALPEVKGSTTMAILDNGQKIKPFRFREIDSTSEVRRDMLDPELNRVLGGGLVEGAFILLGGEPGIGKSTLVLQTILRLP